MTMYLIIDLEEEELKSICTSKQDVIDFAQEYYDYLFAEDDDKRPKDWNMALDFLSANSRYVLDLDKREDYKVNRLIDEIKELRDWADECDNDYACQDMDEAVDEAIMFALQELDTYERLEVLKYAVGETEINRLVEKFKDTCVNYGIRENEDV